jgi:cold shock CspA family protein
MHYGTIIRINEPRGFGFIRQDQRDGRDIFFHCRELRGGLKFNDQLVERRVRYSRVTSEKGFVAVNVFPSDEQPLEPPEKDSARQSA